MKSFTTVVFNPEDFLAISDGQKTQFRRPVNSHISNLFDITTLTAIDYDEPIPGTEWTPEKLSPYKMGDILLVKRLFRYLRITNVRMERLQTITEEDARKEGFETTICLNCQGRGCSDCAGSGLQEPAIVDFMLTWDERLEQANARDRGYTWDTNPWVYVYDFERIICTSFQPFQYEIFEALNDPKKVHELFSFPCRDGEIKVRISEGK